MICRTGLKRLQDYHDYPSLSILAPTYRMAPAKKKDRIVVRNLAAEGLTRLQNEFTKLIHLLPYSPELNPLENLWHYLRAHHWSHGVYPDYEALVEVATETWRTVCLDPEKIRSICPAPYLEGRR
jgi:hypothetical protein